MKRGNPVPRLPLLSRRALQTGKAVNGVYAIFQADTGCRHSAVLRCSSSKASIYLCCMYCIEISQRVVSQFALPDMLHTPDDTSTMNLKAPRDIQALLCCGFGDPSYPREFTGRLA